MKIIRTSIDIPLKFKIKYPLDEICFLDIETTGLNKKYHQIYLIGILIYDNKSQIWELSQFFSESNLDEELILKEYISRIKNYKYMITYNGDNFDIAFINEKLKKYTQEKMYIESIDLYKVLRKNKDFIEFSDLKLKTVEKELGIYREDVFTGLDCIEFYKNYLITRSENFLKYILDHNRDDLYSMPNLMRIFELIENKKSIEIEFLEKHSTLKINNIEQSGDLIIVNANWVDPSPQPSEFYNRFYSLSLNNDSELQIKIEVNRARLKENMIVYYIDTNKFGLISTIEDLSGAKPPENILILRIDKKNILENIINLIKEIISTSKLS